jgi:hypothetical protein
VNLPGYTVTCEGGLLTPRQHPTPLKIKRSTNYVAQRMLKCPERCRFHSLAELYYAALCEGDREIGYFCPQPFMFYIHGVRYIPDVYVEISGKRKVVEIRSKGKFSERKKLALESYLRPRRFEFEVISNETVYEKEIAAQNWLTIIRHLLSGEDIVTDGAETELIEALQLSESIALGDIIDTGHRQASERNELAIYRLLYQGIVQTDLASDFLSYDSELSLCI